MKISKSFIIKIIFFICIILFLKIYSAKKNQNQNHNKVNIAFVSALENDRAKRVINVLMATDINNKLKSYYEKENTVYWYISTLENLNLDNQYNRIYILFDGDLATLKPKIKTTEKDKVYFIRTDISYEMYQEFSSGNKQTIEEQYSEFVKNYDNFGKQNLFLVYLTKKTDTFITDTYYYFKKNKYYYAELSQFLEKEEKKKEENQTEGNEKEENEKDIQLEKLKMQKI